MIILTHLHTYTGPNIYAARPVILASIALDDALLPSAQEKIDRICMHFPNWFTWTPKNQPLESSDVADFLVAFAHATLCEVRGSVRVAQVTSQDGHFLVVLGYHDAGFSFHALQLAASIFLNIETVNNARLQQRMNEFWTASNRLHPDFQAQFLIDYCEANGLPYQPYMPTSNIWQYGSGNKSVLYHESSPVNDNYNWSRNKPLCKSIFQALGAPIVASVLVENESQLAAAIAKVGMPCVVKPTDLARGMGVLANLRDLASVTAAFQRARKQSNAPIMIERFIEGEIHRLIVVRGKFWKAIRRDRPAIISDGVSSVKSQLELENAVVIQKMRPDGSIGPAPLDEDFLYTLKAQGLTPDSIPPKGQKVIVRGIATAEQGSRYLDVTDQVHPDTLAICQGLAQSFYIAVCGLDFITEDISKSCFEMGAFIEINTTPGLRTPVRAGIDPAEVARVVLGGEPARIPVLLVIAGSEQHAAIRKMIPADPTLGWVCGPRSGIGVMEFPDKQAAYLSVQRLLKNLTISAVIVVCDVDELTAQGMPVDRAQATVLYADAQVPEAWQNVLLAQNDELLRIRSAPKLAALFASASVPALL